MAEKEFTVASLIKRIIRAEMILQKVRAPHKDTCFLNDSESYAPCNCNAGEVNNAISEALRELDLEK